VDADERGYENVKDLMKRHETALNHENFSHSGLHEKNKLGEIQ